MRFLLYAGLCMSSLHLPLCDYYLPLCDYYLPLYDCYLSLQELSVSAFVWAVCLPWKTQLFFEKERQKHLITVSEQGRRLENEIYSEARKGVLKAEEHMQ